MTAREHAERLWINLLGLGPRRLAALAMIAVTVLGLVGGAAYYLSQPQLGVLYSGLEKDDASRVGAALKDAGISFDVSADNATVYVAHNQASQARMLLAEKGLPHSASAGYELFNELGSLGLTSFMQEVTRVRAMEGELARTIQTMKGVKAARVHIVLPDRGSFRRDQQPPSASVILRTDTSGDTHMAEAIRQLVAGAVPALGVDRVTVLDTDGTVLASGEDASSIPGSKSNRLERTVSTGIQDNIRRALTPYLGPDNFQISVATTLNTDRSKVAETTFDPESRVERSVRVIRENGASQNTSQQSPTTVEQNLPEEDVTADGGDKSSEENSRREDLTNYEISSKVKETVSDGYSINRLSVALIVNRARIAESLGENPTPEAITARVNEMRDLAASAAGLDDKRGDHIQVSAVDFAQNFRNMEPVPPLTLTDALLRQLGTVVNALAILVVAMLLIWFGLRPAMAALLPRIEDKSVEALNADGTPALEGGQTPQLTGAGQTMAHLLEDMTQRMNNSPMKVLEQLVQMDEEQAATILRQWMKEGEPA
ncbi:flagellar basal-body MS-ring/collar protein FliF [Flaviflagellibacter deserti]|uniref:Flagellar M-ring protein n=1 Tax=Flaviflagellibacter deserti TaxID=2267266 RepID=A0ABV9Z6E3_9HYPH